MPAGEARPRERPHDRRSGGCVDERPGDCPHLAREDRHGAGRRTPPRAFHTENPHYFLFRGRPTFLITSGEHYGVVLSLDFDFLPFIDEPQARGFNMIRLVSGTYREDPGSLQIRHNTLAPWARSRTPSEADGGTTFDLDAWDDAYFRLL